MRKDYTDIAGFEGGKKRPKAKGTGRSPLTAVLINTINLLIMLARTSRNDRRQYQAPVRPRGQMRDQQSW